MQMLCIFKSLVNFLNIYIFIINNYYTHYLYIYTIYNNYSGYLLQRYLSILPDRVHMHITQ